MGEKQTLKRWQVAGDALQGIVRKDVQFILSNNREEKFNKIEYIKYINRDKYRSNGTQRKV